MATTYASPGVYVEEVDRGTKPIEAAGTSLAAFVGITMEASVKAFDPATGDRVVTESRLNKPTLVTSWTQFTDVFGDLTPMPTYRTRCTVISAMAGDRVISPVYARSRKAKAQSRPRPFQLGRRVRPPPSKSPPRRQVQPEMTWSLVSEPLERTSSR